MPPIKDPPNPFSAIREHYLAGLPVTLQKLEALAEELGQSGVLDPQRRAHVLKDMHFILHKVAGSAGIFGLPELGLEAKTLENLINVGSDQGVELDVELQERVAVLRRYLPAEGEGDDKRPAPATGELHPQLRSGARSYTVWVLQGNQEMADDLAQQLRNFDYSVDLIQSTDEFLAKIGDSSPDLVVVDASLTNESGEDVPTVLLRSGLSQVPKCPLVFISSRGDFDHRLQAAKLGATGYMLKPVDVPKLASHIRAVLDQAQSSPYRVLVLEADEHQAEYFRALLRSAGMVAETLGEPETIIEALNSFKPDVLLINMLTPGYYGPDIAGVVRQYEEFDGLAIAFLSSEMNAAVRIEALGRGADDFIPKSLEPAQLVATVQVRAERSRQLQGHMTRDGLTGLLKHSTAKEELSREYARAQRTQQPLSVAMLDIDKFKSINDTHGHAAGDTVIAALATLLQQRLRKSDLIGRYGGDEFVLVMPECTAEQAQAVLNDVRLRFAGTAFTSAKGAFNCSISVGVHESTPGTMTPSEMLARADKALYEAKRQGRNRVIAA